MKSIDRREEIIRTLRASLVKVRTLPEADAAVLLAVRQARWFSKAEKVERDRLLLEIGYIMGELFMGKFWPEAAMLIAVKGSSL